MRQHLPNATPRDTNPLPPGVPVWITDGEGCHSCPHWSRKSLATGFCWAPDAILEDAASVCRSGWQTCFAYICPAHPRYQPGARL